MLLNDNQESESVKDVVVERIPREYQVRIDSGRRLAYQGAFVAIGGVIFTIQKMLDQVPGLVTVLVGTLVICLGLIKAFKSKAKYRRSLVKSEN